MVKILGRPNASALRHDNIFLVGPAGAGKAAIGELLAEKIERPFFDSNAVMRDALKAPILEIYAHERESKFRKRERDIIGALVQQSGIVLTTDAGIVLDRANRRVLALYGTVVYLYATRDAQWRYFRQHLESSSDRPALRDKNPEAMLAQIECERVSCYVPGSEYNYYRAVLQELHDECDPLYRKAADHTVDVSDLTAEDACARVLEQLGLN